MAESNNVIIEFLTRFKDSGVKACVAAMGGVVGAVKKSTDVLARLGTSLGEFGGKFGKAAGDVAKFVTNIQALGAIGAVIGGAEIIADRVVKHYQEVSDRMLEAVRSAGDRIRAKLQSLKAERLNEIAVAMEKVGVEAERTARKFETLVDAYNRVAAAKSARREAENDAAVSGLEAEKRRAMREATKEEAPVVGAEHDIGIAQRKLSLVIEKTKDEIDAAAKDVQDWRERVRLAAEKKAAAEAAVAKAKEKVAEFQDIAEMSSDAVPELAQAQDKLKSAEAALFAATDAHARAETSAAVAVEKEAAVRARSAALRERASADVADAKAAAVQMRQALAEKRAADEQMRQALAEKRAADEAEKKAKAEAEEARAVEESNRELIDMWRQQESAEKNALSIANGRARDAKAKADEAREIWRNPLLLDLKGERRQKRLEAYEQKRYEKDAERLRKLNPDWRTKQMASRRDEATRRRMIAEEKENKAAEDVKSIRDNLAIIKDNIFKLLEI